MSKTGDRHGNFPVCVCNWEASGRGRERGSGSCDVDSRLLESRSQHASSDRLFGSFQQGCSRFGISGKGVEKKQDYVYSVHPCYFSPWF